MIIDCSKYAGPCACGERHALTTREAIIEGGCMRYFDKFITDAGLTGRHAAIYDTNSYHAEGLIRPPADQEIILDAEGLLPNEAAAAALLQQLHGDTALLVAIGAGTVHDLVRYAAKRLGLPFVSCPTAASTDEFAGNSCSMRWHGEKTVMPGVAPVLVMADLDVIRRAPFHLTRAGVCDALSNYTALADWRIACLMTERPSCPAAEAALLQSAVLAQGASEGLKAGDEGAYAQLMYALVLPGLAMQMMQDPFIASGAEHQLSYLLEMQPETEQQASSIAHGELAGISMAIIAEQYHSLAEHDDIAPLIRRYERANADRLVAYWREVRHIIDDIPSWETLDALLCDIGARNISALGIPEDRMPELLRVAPGLRDQLTFARMVRMCNYGGDSKASASRALSRRSRYADSAITRAGSSNAVSASSI